MLNSFSLSSHTNESMTPVELFYNTVGHQCDESIVNVT